MRISLTPETAKRIRGVLGDDDLAPDLLPSVLGRTGRHGGYRVRL